MFEGLPAVCLGVPEKWSGSICKVFGVFLQFVGRVSTGYCKGTHSVLESYPQRAWGIRKFVVLCMINFVSFAK